MANNNVKEKDFFGIVWSGKDNAVSEAGLITDKKLVAQKHKSINWDNTENVYIEGDNLEP